MITIILFVLIGIGFVVYNIIKDNIGSRRYFDWDDLFMLIPAIILGGFIGFLVAWSIPSKYTTDKWSEDLVALQDKNSVEGSFFLGSGYISGTMEYVYYLKQDSNTYKMWQTEYYSATVKYTDAKPTIDITYKHINKNNFWNKFSISLMDNDYSWTCVFNVPKGSIKNNYNLNSQ